MKIERKFAVTAAHAEDGDGMLGRLCLRPVDGAVVGPPAFHFVVDEPGVPVVGMTAVLTTVPPDADTYILKFEGQLKTSTPLGVRHVVEAMFPRLGTLTITVDGAAFALAQAGAPVWLYVPHPTTAAVPVEAAPVWRFELPMGDAVETSPQKLVELGIVVGAVGGCVVTPEEERGRTIILEGPGVAPPELYDWCLANDVTCALRPGTAA